MHDNAQRLEKFFAALNQHDHRTMANFYHPDARFRDIAFHLKGRKDIHAMWHMICEGDIRTTARVLLADEETAKAELVDDYTFHTRSGACRKVRNEILSTFRFRGGLIVEQEDHCDPRQWADQAFGGVTGFLAGRFRLLRSVAARLKLRSFENRHTEYK